MQHSSIPAAWRQSLARFIEQPLFQRTILLLIVLNAVILGMETSPSLVAQWGPWMRAVDNFILAIFVVEISLRLLVHRLAFFRDPWSLFDFIVVAIALIPASGQLGILRALRVLRVLRMISLVPSMRRVVGALLAAIPGLSSIALVLALIFYVSAVITTNLYGASMPALFGNLIDSLYTLFQIMTMDSWSSGILRPLMEQHPYAWLFFIPFLLVATFTMLNLFIAIIVNAMQKVTEEEQPKRIDNEQVHAQVLALREEIAELKNLLQQQTKS